MANQFKLGETLRDKVTGLEGIAIARIDYLNGCVQYAIKTRIGEDGKVNEAEWVDSQQIEKVDDGINVEASETGGVSHDAPRL